MVEAELKFVVRDVGALRNALGHYAVPRPLKYRDQYFTHDVLQFKKHDAEFRLRAVREAEKLVKTVMTYKGGIVDEATQSKSEYEADIVDQDAMRALLEEMGFRCYIEFTKVCEHFTFDREEHSVAATIVTLEEVEGTWLEIESIVEQSAIETELRWLEEFARTLDLDERDRTTARYEDAVARVRGSDIEDLVAGK